MLNIYSKIAVLCPCQYYVPILLGYYIRSENIPYMILFRTILLKTAKLKYYLASYIRKSYLKTHLEF